MLKEQNDEAISPVIGVIIMVAITVILAAVIAAFVFGMDGNFAGYTPLQNITITIVDRIDSPPAFGSGAYCTVLTSTNVSYMAFNTRDCIKMQKGSTVIATLDRVYLTNVLVVP